MPPSLLLLLIVCYSVVVPGGLLRVSGAVGARCRHCSVSSRIASLSFSRENLKMSSMFCPEQPRNLAPCQREKVENAKNCSQINSEFCDCKTELYHDW